MNNKIEVLQACTVEGNIVKLPGVQLDRKLYMEVANALQLIGGKWKGGKVSGFVFAIDPTDLLAQIAGGEKRNLKKEHQFFATPAELAKKMVAALGIQKGEVVLEPSAGQGALIDAVLEAETGASVIFYTENMPTNLMILEKKYEFNEYVLILNLPDNDFLKVEDMFFNRIIANPPFSKNQDIDHVYKMYEVLASGGRIVTIMSTHWLTATEKKCVAFREWLDPKSKSVTILAHGTFKESGTNVPTVMVTINKPN